MEIWEAMDFGGGGTYLYIEGGGSVQMESGFRPRDRDRTAERMEGVWTGYWVTLEGCWDATHTRPLWFLG